jgi:hypothetical protein
MDSMNITTAQYIQNEQGNNTAIRVTIDSEILFVPLNPANRHYAEIMRQVEAGTLTIQEAD